MVDVMEEREEEGRDVTSALIVHGTKLQQAQRQVDDLAEGVNVMSSPDRSKASTPERKYQDDDDSHASPSFVAEPFEREERVRQRVLSVTSLVNEDLERTRKFSVPNLSEDSCLGLDDTDELSQSHNFFNFDHASNPCASINEILEAIGKEKSIQITGIKVDEDALDKLDRYIMELCDFLEIFRIERCLAKGSIQSITLARCELDDHVVSKIAKMLQSDQWQCLRSLSLDGNPSISDEGAKSLAKGLAENKTLEDLSLWGTGIGDEGAKAIAESLKQNCTLRSGCKDGFICISLVL